MKSYVVMADNREKIICVSDDLRLARGAGWDWLKKQYNPDNWQDILEDMDYESENDLRHDMLLGACLCRNAAKPMGMNPSRREWKPKKRTRYLFSGIRIAWFIWFHFPKRQRNFAGGLKSWACWMKICGGRFVATM